MAFVFFVVEAPHNDVHIVAHIKIPLQYGPQYITKIFQTAIRQFPAVLITGPRQSGKSTFLQHVLKDVPYQTFDAPLNRDFASQDPSAFLDQFKGHPLILDEIQYVPQLFQYIKIEQKRARIFLIDHILRANCQCDLHFVHYLGSSEG